MIKGEVVKDNEKLKEFKENFVTKEKIRRTPPNEQERKKQIQSLNN